MDTQDLVYSILRKELDVRIKNNPHYSLRSFAQSTGLNYSVLSLGLNRKRPFSKKVISKILETIDLPFEVYEQLASFLDGENKERQVRADEEVFNMKIEEFETISDPNSLAILGLLKLDKFQRNPNKIFSALGVSKTLFTSLKNKLLRLELIEEEDDRLVRKVSAIRFNNKVSKASSRLYNKSIIEKSLNSLKLDPVNIRDFSSISFLTKPKHINEIRGDIQSFRRYLSDKYETIEDDSNLYCVSVQLFPISKPEMNN